MDIKQRIKEIKETFKKDLKGKNLDDVYLKYFSKKHGEITQLMKELPNLSAEEKKEMGPELNKLQSELKDDINNEKGRRAQEKLEDPTIDLTIPEKPKKSGHLHPTTQVIKMLDEFFRYHGFSVYDGPEIENEENNFRKLNLPENHPATDLQDSLYIEPGILLRTHSSSIEARALTELEPPIRIVGVGKCYRNETPNKTNAAYFYQYQGVVVDKNITIKHLKTTLTKVHRFLFGDDVELRFRYKYYPEVSPGMGVDMKCKFCKGKGCEVCKQRGWIEMLGSGMVHYNTLKMCGIDPEEYTGFAFGMGLDRQVMQKFGVEDIRKLYGGGMVYTD